MGFHNYPLGMEARIEQARFDFAMILSLLEFWLIVTAV